MALTPLDIKKQEFDKVFRGYDPVAVDAFLELAAEEMGDLVARVNTLEERLRTVSETLDDYRQMEQALKDTMLSAQKLADESKDAAERDAELIRREARVEADRILAEAERRRSALEERISELESRERAFLRKMKSFLDDHRKALEDLEPGAPLPEESAVEAGAVEEEGE
ncbi:MAG: DivIVA domain-containing protein [Gemmatimonadota bacterium]|nr:DivIVA domain-containing protein [Gemmatimonadota bacterium]